MTCDEIKELTVPYLELDLEPSRVRDITTHLDRADDSAKTRTLLDGLGLTGEIGLRQCSIANALGGDTSCVNSRARALPA